MKKTNIYFMGTVTILLGLFILLNFFHKPTSSLAQESICQIIINGAKSQIQPTESQGVQYIPLYFPLEDDNITYQINIEYDKSEKIAKIEKIKINKKLRGDHKCERCEGSGKCQACYPAGSGKNIQEAPCPVCDGTGKCSVCRGEGSY